MGFNLNSRQNCSLLSMVRCAVTQLPLSSAFASLALTARCLHCPFALLPCRPCRPCGPCSPRGKKTPIPLISPPLTHPAVCTAGSLQFRPSCPNSGKDQNSVKASPRLLNQEPGGRLIKKRPSLIPFLMQTSPAGFQAMVDSTRPSDHSPWWDGLLCLCFRLCLEQR